MPTTVPFPDGDGPPNDRLPDFGYDIPQLERFYETRPPPVVGYRREFHRNIYEVEDWDCRTGLPTGQFFEVSVWEYREVPKTELECEWDPDTESWS